MQARPGRVPGGEGFRVGPKYRVVPIASACVYIPSPLCILGYALPVVVPDNRARVSPRVVGKRRIRRLS